MEIGNGQQKSTPVNLLFPQDHVMACRKQNKAKCKAICPLVQTHPFRDMFFKKEQFFYSRLRKSLIIYFPCGSHTDLATYLGPQDQ